MIRTNDLTLLLANDPKSQGPVAQDSTHSADVLSRHPGYRAGLATPEVVLKDHVVNNKNKILKQLPTTYC